MEALAEKIAQGEKSVYLVRGDEDFKMNLMREMDEYAGGIVTIPKMFLEFNPMNEDNEDLMDCVTIRILVADFFIVYLDNFDEICGSKIKELVSDDFFQFAYYLLDRRGPPQKRKLIIVSKNSPKGTIFTTDQGLKSRCAFIA